MTSEALNSMISSDAIKVSDTIKNKIGKFM